MLELKGARKAYGPKTVLDHVNLHIERGDRIALVGHNGAGKSTLMRLLSAEEAPEHGARTEGHQVVPQYFAQDEATRLDPTLTVYETLSAGSPDSMVPAIRNILGGFLFSGDDVYKKAGVLSGGERTRLAVARMLLRPSNTLLLDEPTNHLDLDSKEVLLDALADYGGTLVFVSHDRYFVERLATRIVEVGGPEGDALSGHLQRVPLVEELRCASAVPSSATATWRQGPAARCAQARRQVRAPQTWRDRTTPATAAHSQGGSRRTPRRNVKRPNAASAKRRSSALTTRISELEARIAEREGSIKALESVIAAPDFYVKPDEARPILDQHQHLMWEVGDLLSQWEMLQSEAETFADLKT